jgi:sugar transferase (PEP-CTERM/EpsH1 system associated)
LLRALRPAVVHTRNLATLEGAVVARFAGVPSRIHGEHGWDVYDADGTNWKYRMLRRCVNPAVHRFVGVSREIERWLTGAVGIRAEKVTRICNGVDTDRFRPSNGGDALLLPPERFPSGAVVVGSVTRFSDIKDPLNLVRAFIAARKDPAGAALRLVMVGDGALRTEAQRLLCDADEEAAAWLPGSRDDIPQLLRAMDMFALGSLREGISNTVLEAMASGLPVIATATGGNLELVQDGISGRLVAPGNPGELAAAMLDYACRSAVRLEHGKAGRTRVEQEYSMKRMLADYEALYHACCSAYAEAV